MNTPVSSSVEVKGIIDHSLPFMPSFLTPLYHTPSYRELTGAQRLRYNQLHALYFNEQILFFERALAENIIEPFLTDHIPDQLKEGLREFIAEERRHSTMFQQLNRLCRPKIYSGQDFYFIRIPWLGARLLDIVSRHPKFFPLFLWLAHIQEERSIFFAKAFLHSEEKLEPHFLSMQRTHLADEIGHVHHDQALLSWIWPRTPSWLRRLNVRLLGWMMEEYFSQPKRAGLRVLDELVRDFPELQALHSTLRRQLLDLKDNSSYRISLYSRDNIPETFNRFDAWPEFRRMSTAMPGYTPFSS